MNDESDLNRLQTITLRWEALDGDICTIGSNVLIMKSMNENDND